MKVFKKIFNRLTATVLSITLVGPLAITGIAHASAQTCVWTGATSGVMNVAGNWSSCNNSTPQAGDIISLSNTATNVALTNNLGVSLGGVLLTHSGSTPKDYTVNTLTLASGATIDGSSAGGFVSLDVTALTAQGTLTVNNWFGEELDDTTWAIPGVLTVAANNFRLLDTATHGNFVVQNGATLVLVPTSATPAAVSSSFTLGGGAGSGAPDVEFDSLNAATTTWNVTGGITLLANALFNPYDGGTTVNVTGAISGTGFALSRDTNGNGTLVLSPSSNSSSTVAGTTNGNTNASSGSGASVTAQTPRAPGTPDTGFAMASSKPGLVVGAGVASALVILGVALKNRRSTARR